jgi:ribosomal protein S18 acetylase RimI-like enzyme
MWKRAFLKALFGEYSLWHIYSIATRDCKDLQRSLSISPIDDLSLFTRSGLDPDLRKSDWSAPGARGFVASADGGPVGVCWYWTGNALAQRNVGQLAHDEAELIQITIAPAFRGRGIGTQLIADTAIRMRRAGFRRLYAQIWHSNEASRRAFTTAGWHKVALCYRVVPPWLPRSLQVKRMTRSARATRDILANWRAPELNPPERPIA